MIYNTRREPVARLCELDDPPRFRGPWVYSPSYVRRPSFSARPASAHWFRIDEAGTIWVVSLEGEVRYL